MSGISDQPWLGLHLTFGPVWCFGLYVDECGTYTAHDSRFTITIHDTDSDHESKMDANCDQSSDMDVISTDLIIIIDDSANVSDENLDKAVGLEEFDAGGDVHAKNELLPGHHESEQVTTYDPNVNSFGSNLEHDEHAGDIKKNSKGNNNNNNNKNM